jgi:methionyl-tRNA formyltransferase
MRIVLAAEESAGLQVLRALLENSHELVAVLAAEPVREDSRATVWKAAKHNGCEVWPAALVREASFAAQLERENVDLLLNVHSLHRMNDKVLQAPRLGAYNLHPAPLPRYAGLSSVSWAIFNGEKTHGVTVHRMAPAIDAGAIAYQTSFPIVDEDTGLSISLRCVREGVPLIERLLQDASAGMIPAMEQDVAARTWFGRNPPNSGWIDWNWSARQVIDFIRACDYRPFQSPWGQPKAQVGMQSFALIEASRTATRADAEPGFIGERSDSGLYVACADEWIVANKVLYKGKALPASEFLRTGDRMQMASACAAN